MVPQDLSTYEDIRESGFLKLPSGRLLSDYKNFSSPQSGWQTSTLRAMRDKFDKVKIGKRGQLGGLFFDEVKIKGIIVQTIKILCCLSININIIIIIIIIINV